MGFISYCRQKFEGNSAELTNVHKPEQYDGHHGSSSFVVYHGQTFSQIDFNQLVQTQASLLSFNNFLLTNKTRQVSLNYASETMETSDKVKQKPVLPYHLNLATSYNNISSVYDKMDEYLKALSSYEKAFEIYEKILPPSRLNSATTYNNIGKVLFSMSEYAKAVSYYEHALNIGQRSLPPDHPYLQLYKDNVEYVKKQL